MQPFVDIGKGITLASGLKWLPVDAVNARERNREIASLSKTFDANLIVSLKNPYQIGLANTVSGYKPSMLSMAAAVNDFIQKKFGVSTFHCAFEIGNGIWGYVAVQDKTILPSITGICGDMISTEAEIRQMFMMVRTKLSFELEIAPEAWQTDAIEIPFIELLARRKNGSIIAPARWRLKALKKGQWQKRVLLLISFLSFGLFCWYWHHTQDLQKANALKEARVASARNRKAAHPWKNQARAITFAKACQARLKELPYLFPAGWAFHSAVCTQDAMTLTWNRPTNAQTADLLFLYPEAKLAKDGNNAFLELALPLQAGDDEELDHLAKRERAMIKTASALGLTLMIDEGERSELPGRKPSPMTDGWKKFGWKLKDCAVSPTTVISEMDAPGLRVVRIQTQMKNGLFVWNLEGEQYGK